ncbi:MAG: hypothetical protein DSM106950_45305 [Stigonema ocellatum SAG 48.90 = DSM 106950]|nr:hypothetical protein [Stigonema ocellatum SAG 48.90 = DSM 106950]
MSGNGNHHGCATQEDGLIECLRSFSQQDPPPGYRFIKLLRNDMGGLFVFDDGSDNQKETPAYSQQQRHSANCYIPETATTTIHLDIYERTFSIIHILSCQLTKSQP